MNLAVYHDLPSGGAKRALREQVAGLRALGHRVDVFIPSTAEERFLPLADVASSVRVFPQAVPPARERVLEGNAPLDLARWAGFLRRVRRLDAEIAAAIDAGGYDVVLVHPSQFTQAPHILRRLRTRSVYYCHEPLRAAYERRISPPWLRLLIRATIGRMDRRNLRAATTVAVNSAFTAARVRAIYGRSASVLYLGVDAQRFRPLGLPQAGFVLTVAALHPLKGLDFLLDVLARVPAAARPPLVVVSDRSRAAEQRRLEARARQAAVKLDFRFRVEEEELVALYNRARLVLYAPYDEPFGFVPLEAMACGRPVLAVREGGIPESVQDGVTGFLAPREPGTFASRLTALLTDPRAAERVGARAPELVRERWRWDRHVDELAELCRRTARVAAPAGVA
ncbi:MAG: glycosyltransferase family 4 protein [Gemmatimonadetes bacterium]|nr:glycosyltransferase family 4 protein [Gemmatimonadota bacterium]